MTGKGRAPRPVWLRPVPSTGIILILFATVGATSLITQALITTRPGFWLAVLMHSPLLVLGAILGTLLGRLEKKYEARATLAWVAGFTEGYHQSKDQRAPSEASGAVILGVVVSDRLEDASDEQKEKN